MAIPFTKMHGLGNDYVYIDGFAHQVPDPAGLSRQISDRHFGVGSDGLILILPPESGVEADVRMRMFNADGSEAEMCGNGVRCVCKFAHDRDLSRARPMRVQTGRGVLTLDYQLDSAGRVDRVTVDMGEPILDTPAVGVELPRPTADGRVVDVPLRQYIALGEPASWMSDCELGETMTAVSMGNPHLIIECGVVAAVPLEWIGPFLETQPIFPDRINVHFVQINAADDATIRTWERGSGITMACGTGACAVCVAGALRGRSERRITAHLPGGDLSLEWDQSTNHVSMTGPAVHVFDGAWSGNAVCQ